VPAFLVRFAFVADAVGAGLLLTACCQEAVGSGVTAIVGVAALAGGIYASLFRRTTVSERAGLIAAGPLLVSPKLLLDVVGVDLVVMVMVVERPRRQSDQTRD
jgi:TRAP-type uncharacterized transport system fused permease subunit